MWMLSLQGNGMWKIHKIHCVLSQEQDMMIANCPVHYVSKLETEVAVSTMEAEYFALSTAMRDLIPL